MAILKQYPKRIVLLILYLWLGVSTTQAQTNNTSPKFRVGVGYSRLPLEPMEEYALDFWYAPISLLIIYEPKSITRFTFSIGFQREKHIYLNDTFKVNQQAVLSLSAFRLWQSEHVIPYVGVRIGIVQRRIKYSDSTRGRVNGDNYFAQGIVAGEVAIFNSLRIGLEMIYQYAAPKFWIRGEHVFDFHSFPSVRSDFGSNICVHYALL